MNSSVCTLNNSNAFTSTPYAGYSASFSGTPYIYVPTSLVDAYKSATNWTYFSSYIVGYDNTITFTIKHTDGSVKTYQAKEGMSWGEWVNSEYNTDGFVNSSGDIIYDYTYVMNLNTDTYTNSEYIILNNDEYYVHPVVGPAPDWDDLV
jgi:hypothetical protein